MLKFLHAADVHLDSPMRGLERYEGAPLDELRGASRRAFENLVGLAIETQVAFVLIAGDLYDGAWRDFSTPMFFGRRMAELREAGIDVLVVFGNHDAESRMSAAFHRNLPSNVRILAADAPETVELERHGVVVHGQSFERRAVTENLVAGFPPAVPDKLNIGMVHTSLDGREGHEPYAPCAIEDLLRLGYDYWALGHVHGHEIVARDPWVVFPGNVQGRNIRECGPKGAVLVTVDDDRVASVEHRELDVARWVRCEVDATGAETSEEILTRLRDALETHLEAAEGRPLAARLLVTGPCAAHAELARDPHLFVQTCRLQARDAGGGSDVWLEKVRLSTRPVADLETMARRDDVLGGLLRTLDDAADDATLRELVAADLRTLESKLPPGLQSGDHAFGLTTDERLRQAVVEAAELLAARLVLSDVEAEAS